MATDYFKRVQQHSATRFWVNNPTRAQADLAISSGAVGCTMNPSYMQKMLDDKQERAHILGKIDLLVKTEQDDTRVLEKLQTQLVMEIAEKFLPVYEASDGTQGFVSIQGDPFNETTDYIVEYGSHNAAQMPNITPKVPVVPEGLEAIEQLLKRGVSINSTEIFAMQQFIDVSEVYERAVKGNKNPPVLFYSHIAGIFDEYLTNYTREHKVDILPDYIWQAGVTVARKMEALRRERGYRVRMISGGARGLHHFTEMVGATACVTINWPGTAEVLLEQNPMVVQRFFQPTPASVVDQLMEKLPPFKQAYKNHGLRPEEYEEYGPVELFRSSFTKGWTQALEAVRERRALV